MYYYEESIPIPNLPQKLVYYLKDFLNFTNYKGTQVCEPSIEYFTSNLSQSFAELLLQYIDKRGLKDCEVYKKLLLVEKYFIKLNLKIIIIHHLGQ